MRLNLFYFALCYSRRVSINEHPPRSGLEQAQIHVPVLLEATLQLLQPRPGESYLDLTAGYGGHARAILHKTNAATAAVLVDRDPATSTYLSEFTSAGAELKQTDFATAAEQLVEEDRQFDVVLADLGVSSPQLDQSKRGFSFRSEGPLDMRMDSRQETTAADIVNTASADELITIIRTFGEEPTPVARRIVEAMIAARPLETTSQLAEVVASAVRRQKGRIHPATRTFQALRIATNQELAQLARLLELLPKLVAPGGRIGIISFHSLEDRLVKQYFAQQQARGYEAEFQILTKKPIRGVMTDVHNLRARSASLRAAVKT